MYLDFKNEYQNLHHTRKHAYKHRRPEQKRWNSSGISARALLPH